MKKLSSKASRAATQPAPRPAPAAPAEPAAPEPLLEAIHYAPIAETTRASYLQNLKTMCRLMGKEYNKPVTVKWLICHPAEVIKALHTAYPNYLTRKSMVIAAKAVFKHSPKAREKYADCYAKWDRVHKQLEEERTNVAHSLEPTEREREAWVPWPEVLEAERMLARECYGDWPHLLLAMYCLIEPLRADFGNVRIVQKDLGIGHEQRSYLIEPQSKLVLKDTKTSKHHGFYERQLPEKLMRIIMRSRELCPRDHLFIKAGAEPVPFEKRNSFVQYANRELYRIFNRPVTIRMLRQSYISSMDFSNMRPSELYQAARHMNHSLGMQQQYRRKMVDKRPEQEVMERAQEVLDTPEVQEALKSDALRSTLAVLLLGKHLAQTTAPESTAQP